MTQSRGQSKYAGEFLKVTVDREQRELILGSEENKRLLKNCLSGILVLSQNKKTIHKTELNKLIYTGSRAQHHTVRKAVMANANHDLNKYLGMRLFELPQDRGYLLVNSASVPNDCRREFDSYDCNSSAAMFLTLMQIFSSADESSSETQIKSVLETLGLPQDELNEHFSMLTKKLYIVRELDNAYDKDEKIYRWGPRAVAEVDPDKFMKSFLDFTECGSADDWPEQKRRIDLLKKIPNRTIH